MADSLETAADPEKLKRVVIEPLTRVEGHGKVTLLADDHGHIRQATCIRCYHVVPTDGMLRQFIRSRELPRCEKCGSILKPNIILFGEQLPYREIHAARQATQSCDVLLVAGSSLNISPVADLPYIARDNGAQVILINQQPTPFDEQASLLIHEDVAVALPGIVDHLIRSG